MTSQLMCDKYTDETFPLANYSIGTVLDMIDAEMEAITEESFRKWGPETGEVITEFLAIRDAFYELMQDQENPVTRLTLIDEGVVERFEQTHNVEEYLTGLGEQQLRGFIWDEIQDRCARCGDHMDYCQGHGVLG